jgi:hypothetical protein
MKAKRPVETRSMGGLEAHEKLGHANQDATHVGELT